MKPDTFVAVDERVIENEVVEIRCRHLEQICVKVLTAEEPQLYLQEVERVLDRQEGRIEHHGHSASFLNTSP